MPGLCPSPNSRSISLSKWPHWDVASRGDGALARDLAAWRSPLTRPAGTSPALQLELIRPKKASSLYHRLHPINVGILLLHCVHSSDRRREDDQFCSPCTLRRRKTVSPLEGI